MTSRLPVVVSGFFQEELAVGLSGEGSAKALIHAQDTEPGITNSGRSLVAVSSTGSVPQSWLETLQNSEVGKWSANVDPDTPNSSCRFL